MLDIARIRAETPGCANVAHFNNAGASLPPRPVLDTVRDHLEAEALWGGYEAADAAMDRLSGTYASLARLVGADPSEIAITQNATRAWDTACYGMEYFCNAGDETWDMDDADLIARAKREIAQLGLARAEDIVDGSVVRQPKAYPVYDDAYKLHVDTIAEGLEAGFSNLHLAGRNGMHKYNNQDHAMMTGMLTARNIMAGTIQHNVWTVNEDAEYHEGGDAGTVRIEERLVPRRVA